MTSTDTHTSPDVRIDGWQDIHGTVTERAISFYGSSEGAPLTAVQARAMAGALLAAAEALDTLDGPHPVDSATRQCCGGIGGHRPDC